MQKRSMAFWLFLITLIICSFGIVNAMQCPAGTHTFSGGTEASDAALCIPDVGKSGSVSTPKETPTGTLPTSGTYDELWAAWERYCRWGTVGITQAQCDQLEEAADQAYESENTPAETPTTETSDDDILNPKSIGEFSNEELDQQTIDGNKLISDVDKIKQLVSDEVSSAAGKYSSEVYQQASKMQDDANQISSEEYTKAQTDANNLAAQMKNCDQCWQSKPNSEGCQCRNSLQRQINIGSYEHFMSSFQAQHDALDQIKELLKNSKLSSEETTTEEPSTSESYTPYYTPTEQTGTEPTTEQPQNPQFPESGDSAAEQALLEAVLKSSTLKHQEELTSIQNYYARSPQYPGMSDDEEAGKDKFAETPPLVQNLVNAKNDYQDALKKGVSSEEALRLKTAYDQKMLELKSKLSDVLELDSSNPDALWQLGTLSKWQGDNKRAYENYRDALSSEKDRNFFQYQQRLNLINDPAMRMQLLQMINPEEKALTLPTIATSPLLKGLKNNLNTLVQPVNEKKREAAETIEKISRAFSLSDHLPQKLKELSWFAEEKNNE